MLVVVDVANVVGSRPDGWWRDRAGAAGRLLARLARLPGATVAGPDGTPLTCTGVVAVVEGAARDVAAPDGVRVVRAAGSGDDALVAAVAELESPVLVVTADRGLRGRLPERADPAGPGWLLACLDRLDGMIGRTTG
ncbi:hypothetical protein [Blastococcus saxobsidens]|uniref:NTP pyrophosphohydrolase n=1 Tax=Blastococcus saxobsidens (strain DD2) TaxID=1146883 RepID=H6RS52_BLASD|nr:hypothetical protein [Blastococcus saxobsidens]CCG04246.1 conserved protein of unknown function [Blastococcus saxobsidens DD2]